MFNLSIIDNVQFKWLNFIKSIFEKTGLNYLWNQQQNIGSISVSNNLNCKSIGIDIFLNFQYKQDKALRA
jgi:hypothetical protein